MPSDWMRNRPWLRKTKYYRNAKKAQKGSKKDMLEIWFKHPNEQVTIKLSTILDFIHRTGAADKSEYYNIPLIS
jgi:hypothetical protein